MYHFSEHTHPDEMAGCFRDELSGELFRNPEVTLCYNFCESLVVPERYAHEETESAMLSLVFGADDQPVFSDVLGFKKMLGHVSAKNIYRVSRAVHEALLKIFPSARVMHSTSLQLAEEVESKIDVTFYPHEMKVLLFDGGLLRLCRQFTYKTPADAAYQLLNVCHQHALNPETIPLNLQGMIEADSNLLRELEKYFLLTERDERSGEAEWVEELSDVQSGFFNYLTKLVQCAS